VKLPKYKQVAAMVRDQVADGILAPGAPAPSGAALSRMTGYSVLTCRRALRALIADGVLVHGASGNARPRVPGPGDKALADAKRDLSRALARHRRAAGLTQPQLAALVGLSVTTIGHAETGRIWQARPFWEHADKLLNADGELLRLHDAFRAAEVPPEEPVTPEDHAEIENPPPVAVPADPPVTVMAGAPELVASIAITWAGGGVTTVYPPGKSDRRYPQEPKR
jgi:DNA-binding XRE family transcriptional regulator